MAGNAPHAVAIAAVTVLVGALVVFPASAASPSAEPSGFVPAGLLAQERSSHTATLLTSGAVLVVGGWDHFPVAPAELWVPAMAQFEPARSLCQARGDHTATLLPDGRVLVIGGMGDAAEGPPRIDWLDSATIWDPATATFTETGPLHDPRSFHTATLLPSGRVLVLGGSPRAAASAEIWSPKRGRFTRIAPLTVGRSGHTATLLPDGRVLVIGGNGSSGTAELWDPATQESTPTGSLAQPRTGHTATLLPDGRVLVVGGMDQEGESSIALASAELYDPATGTFEPAGTMAEMRVGHTATLLPDGGVLVAGGAAETRSDTAALASTERWDPATRSFVAGPPMIDARTHHTATLLPDGALIVIGGYSAGRFLAASEILGP